MSTAQIIGQIISKLLEIEEKFILENPKLEDMQIDSLDFFEIITEIEKQFDIEIPDKSLDKISVFNDLVDIVDECRLNQSNLNTRQ